VSELIAELLDSARLLVDLQQVSEVAHSFSGGLTPDAIAQKITDALGERFDCAFSRIWLVEPDQSTLKLVASSGLHTRTDGFFARVPMGAFKVGKIAQNRIAFLSNNLPEETWVKDRDWAVAHNIRGFAGYPLAVEDRVVGVLATFSHHSLSPEFLEVLRVLCMLATVALDAAITHRKPQIQQPISYLLLSDRLAGILRSTPLTLTGTEQPLPLSSQCVFLRIAEVLETLRCSYCRLTYESEGVELTAIIAAPKLPSEGVRAWIDSALGNLLALVSYLGGSLQTQLGVNSATIQVLLRLPYPANLSGLSVRIQCRQPLLQAAFTQLAYTAGLTVSNSLDNLSPVLTDDPTYSSANQPIIWIQTGEQPLPKGIRAKVDLSMGATDLRQVVEAVSQDKVRELKPDDKLRQLLSEREVETLKLLAQGMRDREIAETLFISESTVKFHMNNVLAKLKARTRYQALYQAARNSWI
jgi:DNA-binding CsgD family transcriptional regulator/GAF domain-containing protein